MSLFSLNIRNVKSNPQRNNINKESTEEQQIEKQKELPNKSLNSYVSFKCVINDLF